MKKWLCFLLLTCAGCSIADETRYAGASMELGVGARSLALGGYAAASYGSIDNFHCNPAAAALLNRPVVSVMYAPSYGAVTDPLAVYHYCGFQAPLFGGATVGVHWTRFFVDGIPLYPELKGGSLADRLNDASLQPDGHALGYFQNAEDVVYLSFGRVFRHLVPLGWLYGDLPVEIPLGITIKILRQSLHQNSASALGLDLGAMLNFSLERLLDSDFLGQVTLAFSALDIARTPILWNTRHEDRVQRTMLFGLGYAEDFGMRDGHVQLFYTQYRKYDTAHLLGVEACYRGLALRSGMGPQGWNLGAGLRWHGCAVDYAFSFLDFSQVHRLSCSFTFKREAGE